MASDLVNASFETFWGDILQLQEHAECSFCGLNNVFVAGSLEPVTTCRHYVTVRDNGVNVIVAFEGDSNAEQQVSEECDQ